jgi:outer membrane protein OmpA-like peptidoglycan-associated protein
MQGSISPLTGLVTAFQVEETATEIIVDLAADVLFPFDSADLMPGAPEQLRKTIAQIQRGGQGDIRVVGHTDSQGEGAYNDDLSLRRARAVAAWLSSEGGVPSARVKAEGRGEREPAASNQTSSGMDDPNGRARNRRVQVIIPKA